MGIPMVGCECSVCRSPDPRNHRFRCSVLIQSPGGNILIDTSPELRLQLLRQNVSLVHAVLYTHYHADHIYGLDDLRPIPLRLGGPVPLYCNAETEMHLRRAFAYAFETNPEIIATNYLPQLTFHNIGERPFDVLGERITPIPLQHAQFNVLGFRIGDVAYCTDVNHIPDSSWRLLEGLDVLILDSLRYRPHRAHFSIDEALDVVRRIKPSRAYFTHISHDIDHATANSQLPMGVEMAYDGLSFSF